jgi:predicted ATPase
MLREVRIKNLRSIKDATLHVAPITLLYGPNGAGKSSLIQALAFARNALLTPAQPLDSFFTVGPMNFGGFDQLVFDHDPKHRIIISLLFESGETSVRYTVEFGKPSGKLRLEVEGAAKVDFDLDVTFPYSANLKVTREVAVEEATASIEWNGIVAQMKAPAGSEEKQQVFKQLLSTINSPIEELKAIDFVNLMRGFSKPTYSSVPLTPNTYKEDELATILATDPYLKARVSDYLERVTNHSLSVHVPLGTATFWPQTTDRAAGIATEVVSDGFGINQLVFLLTKCARRESSVICIEEPEVHLHPSTQKRLARLFSDLIDEEQKTFIISTHSETFMACALALVADRALSPSKVSFNLVQKTRKVTTITPQTVNEKGQVEGGLASFMESELSDLRALLGVDGGARQ